MFRRLRDRNGIVPQDGGSAAEEGGLVGESKEGAEPTDPNSPLARAWFEKRKMQLQTQSNATAVDVDAVSVWGNEKNKKSRIKPNENDNDSYLEGSAHSIVTDRTPVVSNQRPGFKRRPTDRSVLPSFTTVMTNNATELSCQDVFDIRKWHGKVLYGLIILLVLSIITVVATAFFSGRGPASEVSMGSPNKPSISPTTQLGLQPSPAPGSVVLTTSPPRPEAVDEPATTESAAPAVALAMLPPPTQETVAPTPSPTSSPLLVELGFPTTAQPTTTPTSSPTVSLTGLVESLDEVHRIDASSQKVTLSGNGRVMAVVMNSKSIAAGSQNVTVYEWSGSRGGNWVFRSANRVGEATAVSLNHDGSIMAISAPFESVPAAADAKDDTELVQAGRVQVFLYELGVTYRPLGQELHGKTEKAFFGHSVALSYSGTTIAIGAPSFVVSAAPGLVGEVQVFEFSVTQFLWQPVGSPLRGVESEDWFGSAVSIGQEPGFGNQNLGVRPVTVAVSAPHSQETGGYVHVYQFVGGDWKMLGRDRDISNKDVDPTLPFDFEDEFGAFLSLVPTNETHRLVVGCPQKDADSSTENSGMAVVYEYNNYDSRWQIMGAPLLSSTKRHQLGQSGKLLDRGNLLVLGVPGSNNDRGLIRFYRFDGTDFVAEEGAVVEGTKSYVEFGRSMDASRRSGHDDTLVIAAVAASGNYTVVLEAT